MCVWNITKTKNRRYTILQNCRILGKTDPSDGEDTGRSQVSIVSRTGPRAEIIRVIG